MVVASAEQGGSEGLKNNWFTNVEVLKNQEVVEKENLII
jgi:hypothetical protein